MPKYMALIYDTQEFSDDVADPAVFERVMAEYTEFSEDAEKAGVIVASEALHDSSTARTVRVEGGRGGKMHTTDGPFAETKEVLGGFYLLECADFEEAVAWAARIPGAWHGKVEVRPVVDFSAGFDDQ